MNDPVAERPAMAAYGVPEEDDGLLDWSWALDRLVANRNYWFTHVDRSGRPHSMPLWGVWMAETNVFWFSTAKESFRVKNLIHNPAVVVATDHTVEVVSVEGVAEQSDGGDPEARAAAAAWGVKYENDETTADEFAAFFLDGVFYRVDPAKAFGIIERPDDFGPSATRWVWPH